LRDEEEEEEEANEVLVIKVVSDES